MPIVPYLQYGGAQVPLRGLLPSSFPPSSISPVELPDYAPIAVQTSQTPVRTPDAALDASHKHLVPTIDIPIDHSSHAHSSGQVPKALAGASGPSDEADTQMKGRKPAIAAAGTFFGLFSFSQIYQNVLFESLTPSDERADEAAWVASSHSWVDRKACDWFGLCGLAHLDKAQWTTKAQERKTVDTGNSVKVNLTDFWQDARSLPDDWEAQEEREIPQYVLDHAPLIHLFSGEE